MSIQQCFTYFPASFTGGEKMRRVLVKTNVTIGASTQIDAPQLTNIQKITDDQTYTISGTKASNDYKGIIIKNHKKYLKK
jgi:hypothetical protein